MTIDLSRQEDIIPKREIEARSFGIIGAGGIGSNVAGVLAKMGAREIHVWDPDVVAPENLAPGFFSKEDLGIPKPLAIHNKLVRELGIDDVIVPHNERVFTKTPIFQDICIIGTDSLSSRRMIWEEGALRSRHWIDARMGADAFNVFYVNLDTGLGRDFYNQFAFAQEEPDLLCGEKATAFLTHGMIAGFIGSMVYNILNDQLPPVHVHWTSRWKLVNVVNEELEIKQPERKRTPEDERMVPLSILEDVRNDR